MKLKKIIAITLGDPLGIGPEIICKALKNYCPKYPIVIIGEISYYQDQSIQVISEIDEITGAGNYFLNVSELTYKTKSEVSYEYVRAGIELALKNKVHALVTAPISKEKWLQAGIKVKGHTELLAKTAGINNYSMFFWSEDLKVSLFTIHIPLQNIFQHITVEKIQKHLRFVNGELLRLFKKEFTLLVSGLNPHAGEGGFLGEEEETIIIPAINSLKGEMNIQGPYPPDTIFLQAKEIKDSVVISWYHDQGLIAFKLLNIHRGVNLTLGLPYIRTSPDHGTAHDLYGKGTANPSSMIESIRLAEYLIGV